METERSVLPGAGGVAASGHEVSVWEDENVLELDGGDACAAL